MSFYTPIHSIINYKNQGVVITYLGEGTSFSVLSACRNIGADYATLTEENFIVGISSINSSSGKIDSRTAKYIQIYETSPISKSYDAATGVLTLSNYQVTADGVDNDPRLKCTSTANCFAYMITGN